jgi:hypothetical protein
VSGHLKPWTSVRGWTLCGLLALLTAVTCKAPGGSSSPQAGVPNPATPPARVIRVDKSSVVIEGRWHPVDASVAPADVSYVVRATCMRSERRCREELTTVRASHPPATETREYKVREWTDWKLLAVRPEGAEEVQLRVSLTGLAAERVTVSLKKRDQPETRWRLE